MRTPTKSLLALTAIGAIALPSAALARQGADDPVGHVRNGAAEVQHGKKHRARHHARHTGVDDAAGHVRHSGLDDGPNHQ